MPSRAPCRSPGYRSNLLQNDVKDLSNQSDELQTLSGDLARCNRLVSSLSSAAGKMLTGQCRTRRSPPLRWPAAPPRAAIRLQVTNLGSYSNSAQQRFAGEGDESGDAEHQQQQRSYTLTVTTAPAPPSTSRSLSRGEN